MPKTCGCYCKVHDDSGVSARARHIARANAHGWFTTTQVSRKLGINVNSLSALLDTGAVPGVRRTKGGHRWVHHSGIAVIANMSAERYKLLMGQPLTSRLPRGIGRAA